MNKTSAPREVQVTHAPSASKFPRGYGPPIYQKDPLSYEGYKRPSKPRINRHPHGYQHLTGNGHQQWLQRSDPTTVYFPKFEAGQSVTPSKAILALETHLN